MRCIFLPLQQRNKVLLTSARESLIDLLMARKSSPKPKATRVATTRSPKGAPFQTQKPVTDPKTPVGAGMFAITGDAAKRLEGPATSTPSGPLPFTQAISGDSVVTPQRLWYYKLTRFNPIRQLKPETLAHYLDLFQMGYLRYFDMLADAIEHRDATLMTVIPKRKAAVKRLHWDVLVNENLSKSEMAEAEEQKSVLYDFYNRARVTSAVDLNVRGMMPMLFDKMLDCRGHRYSSFEIIWEPDVNGDLTARFNWVPAWFFENRTGALRFLEMDYGIDGRPLKEGSWLVCTSDGLLEPCAVAYMYKHMALRDLQIYCEKHAMPSVVGKTDAPVNSENHNAMVKAVHDLAVDFSCVMGLKDSIEKIDVSHAGELPYSAMVDYMDRAMATLWRGADLSTISGRTSQGGQGALLQGKEEYNIQCDDAQLISEFLNIQIDPLVIRWHFGKDAKPLVYFKLVVPPNIEASTDIAIVNAMLSWGVTDIGVKQIHEHFGIGSMMDDDEALVAPAQQQADIQDQSLSKQYGQSLEAADENRLAANERVQAALKGVMTQALDDMARDTSKALEPIAVEIRRVMALHPTLLLPACRKLRKDAPKILMAVNEKPENAQALADAMGKAWFQGLFAAKGKRQ